MNWQLSQKNYILLMYWSTYTVWAQIFKYGLISNDIHLHGIYDISLIVQACFCFDFHHMRIIEQKINIFALRFCMAALVGGGWAVMDRRTEEWLQFETGGDRGDLFWTDSSHFTLLTPSGGCCHTAARRWRRTAAAFFAAADGNYFANFCRALPKW